MFAILRGFQALTVLEITLALVCVIKAVPNDGKDKKILEIVMAEITATNYYSSGPYKRVSYQ